MKAYALLMPLLIGNLAMGAYTLLVPHACAQLSRILSCMLKLWLSLSCDKLKLYVISCYVDVMVD